MFSTESPPLLQPIVTSTPAREIEYHPPPPPLHEIAENENHIPRNQLMELMNSNISNEAHVIMRSNEPTNILPAGIASNDILSVLEEIIPEKSTTPKQNIGSQCENSIKENSDRLNRSHFFLKNIATSMTYLDVFISIVTQYPLVQLNTMQNSQKIQYLCVAGIVLFM